ncbi:MAG: hypothetical protein ACTSRG_22210 [Candidatus Helarchaeota archaeon]
MPKFAKVLFVDETFIKINRTKCWLVLIINEDERVLVFELVRDRKKEPLKNIIDRAREKLPGRIDIFEVIKCNLDLPIEFDFLF